jgi:YhcH/YjgK/YiaL family protein
MVRSRRSASIRAQSYNGGVILDDLPRANLYFALSPGIRKALEFLQSTPPASLKPGRHVIDGDAVVAGVADYATRDEFDSRWEAHRKHIDIQLVLSGEELVGVAPLDNLIAEPYNDANDILFASGQGDLLKLTPGRFLVLFPHDAHMPGLQVGEPAPVRKLVVKVRI